MSLTNEDLLAISNLLDTKLKAEIGPVKQDISSMKQDISSMKQEIGSMKQDIGSMKQEIGSMKQDIGSIKQDIGSMKQEIGSMKQDIGSMKQEMTQMNWKLKRIEIDLLENKVIPRLNTIESCYTSTYQRYQKYTDKIISALDNIEVLNKVVTNHSEILNNILPKMA